MLPAGRRDGLGSGVNVMKPPAGAAPGRYPQGLRRFVRKGSCLFVAVPAPPCFAEANREVGGVDAEDVVSLVPEGM